MLNEMLAFDSEDEKSWTGTDTRPNEIVAEPMDRAGMAGRSEWGGCAEHRSYDVVPAGVPEHRL